MAQKTKKGAQGTGTIRKRSDGRREARYTAGFDPITGKQRQRSIYGKAQREVSEKLTQITSEINDGLYLEPCEFTVAEWVNIWLSDYSFDKKWSTIKHYKAIAKKHILPALGKIPLSQLNPHHIQHFYNALLCGNNGDTPLSPKTVRNINAALGKCLTVAVKMEYLRRNPARLVTLPRIDKKEIHPLTDRQVRSFLLFAENDGYGTLLKTVVFTGLRLSEAISLTWDNVDFARNRLMICKQLQKRPLSAGGFTFVPLTNDKSRVIAPAPFVMDLLRAWQQQQAECRMRAGAAWQGWQSERERQTGLVFTNVLGTHLHQQTVYDHLKK